MRSKWFEYKQQAIVLRKKGQSIRDIELALKIPRSTLSGWFKTVVLSTKQKRLLNYKHKQALSMARQKAVLWHNLQKEQRILDARKQASFSLEKLDFSNAAVVELALALLYLGEGRKTQPDTSMGSSDPLILQFFVVVLCQYFKVPIEKLKCELHLRADQNPLKQQKYWSKVLKIPLKNFTSVSIDKRSIGKSTYHHYQGVCVIRCGNSQIQRKLMAMSNLFCNKIIESYMGV